MRLCCACAVCECDYRKYVKIGLKSTPEPIIPLTMVPSVYNIFVDFSIEGSLKMYNLYSKLSIYIYMYIEVKRPA